MGGKQELEVVAVYVGGTRRGELVGDVVKEMKGAEGVVVVGEGAVAVSGFRGVASARRRQGPRLPPLPLRHFAACAPPKLARLRGYIDYKGIELLHKKYKKFTQYNTER